MSLAGIVATLLVWLAARRTPGLSRRVRILALATFLGTVAQAPLGGITVLLDLHPLAVMSHFLLALVVVALAVMVAFEAWSHHRGLAASPAPTWLRLVALGGVAACAVMVVTGAVATASGPHPGDDSDVERLGIEITDTVYVHVRATAVYGIGLLLVGWWLRAAPPFGAGRDPSRRRAPGGAARADGGGRGAVSKRASLGARARARDARGGDLGAHRRGRLLRCGDHRCHCSAPSRAGACQ